MPAPLTSTATLRAEGISHSLGGRLVLDDVSVTVGPETRLGVVGPNGAGKSTLCRILAGLIVPDAGRVELSSPTAAVGYLSQVHERSAAETVEACLRRRSGVAAGEAELQAATDALATGTPGSDERYAEALERWVRLDVADFDTRLAEVTQHLGLDAGLLSLPTASLSGGAMARVSLAAILLSRFEIILLDEPTNDLDFHGLDLLEQLVASRRAATVVVSHDREFLDRSVNAVLELDGHTHDARLYRGGWSAYLAERAADRRHAEEAHELYEDRRRSLSARAQRERQWATSATAREKRRPRDNDKAQRDFRVNRTEQLAARARRSERALERLEVVDKPWEDWDLRFSVDTAARAGAIVARLEGAVVERGELRLGPFDLHIAWGDRVALVGPNGSGKSTLIETLLGRLALVSGERWLGPSVVVGELDQRRERWEREANLLDAFLADTGLLLPEGRSLLAKFGLGAEDVARPVGELSPGERTRAELARFQAAGVNFLVLDEPTNHLDLPAVEQLESALDGYRGTLLLVSHDRRLLESVELTRTVEVQRPGLRRPRDDIPTTTTSRKPTSA